jgi:hypothetical protein
MIEERKYKRTRNITDQGHSCGIRNIVVYENVGRVEFLSRNIHLFCVDLLY